MGDVDLSWLWVCAIPVGWLVVMSPVVLLVNRAIGRTYDQAHARVKASGDAIYAEDGAKLRVGAFGWIGASMRWLRCDVRVHDDALYVLQWRPLLGKPMGQPVIRVLAQASAPDRGGRSIAMTARAIRVDDDAVVISGTWAGFVRGQLRISGRAPRELAAALDRIGLPRG